MENLEEIKKDKNIKTDRLRFTKNNVPAYLIYVAIVLDVLYFILIYKTNNNYFYTPKIGISVITNLIFLLASFLSSEGIKNYKKNYAFVMIALGIIQIVRIFIYPVQAHSTDVVVLEEVTGKVLDDASFTTCLVYLITSASCLIAGAIIGYLKSVKLENYTKSLHQ